MKQKHASYTIIAVSVLAAGGAFSYVFLRGDGASSANRPAADLAEQAANATDLGARERAAVGLGSAADLTPAQVRPLLGDDQPIEVRAAAIKALGATKDWSSIPTLFQLCEDRNPLVRGRAGAALQQIMGADYQFRANDPPEKRQRALETMRYLYGKSTPPPTDKSRPNQKEPTP